MQAITRELGGILGKDSTIKSLVDSVANGHNIVLSALPNFPLLCLHDLFLRRDIFIYQYIGTRDVIVSFIWCLG